MKSENPSIQTVDRMEVYMRMNVFVNRNYYLHRGTCYMSVICSADPRFSIHS